MTEGAISSNTLNLSVETFIQCAKNKIALYIYFVYASISLLLS